MANKIQVRRGTKAQITAAGPFAAGEPVYALDTRELVIGNGTGANTPVVTATSADITYYVRTDGNDANTGLANTAAGAFKTINKAISMIPQMDNHQVIINVAAGTYAEDVVVSDFVGRLSLQAGNTAIGQTNVRTISFQRCIGRFEAYGFTGTSTAVSVFTALYSQQVIFTSCWVSAASTTQNAVEYTFSSGRIQDGSYSNRANAIVAAWGCLIYVNNVAGSGNVGNGILAIRSSYVGLETSVTPTGATSNYYASSGSTVITTGGGVINPWGDNTLYQRSACRAYAHSSTPQALAANVWTKALYPQENFDNAGNYDPALSRFTVSQTGLYQTNVLVAFLNPAAGVPCEVFLYVNGSAFRRLSYVVSGGAYSLVIGGSASIILGAGDFIEVYARCGSVCNIGSSIDSNFEVARIA